MKNLHSLNAAHNGHTPRTTHPLRSLALAILLCAGTATAQDLVITNGRILDGNGGVIDNGTVVIRGGRIESVVAGNRAVNGRHLHPGGRCRSGSAAGCARRSRAY